MKIKPINTYLPYTNRNNERHPQQDSEELRAKAIAEWKRRLRKKNGFYA